MNVQQILKHHRDRGSTGTVLVDDMVGIEASGIARLSEMNVNADCLWADDHYLRDIRTAIISKPRSAKDLYRILSSIERFIAPGGSILILPYSTEAGPENRFEATEIFLGIYHGWMRNLVEQATVELKKVTDRADVVTAQARGGKRVISLAVFGKGGYWDFLPAFIRAHHTLFRGFELWVHHDDAINEMPYGKALRALETIGLLKLVAMPSRPSEGKTEKMLWRVAPAWDLGVEYVFCRDLDSLPMWRDRCAVEEFIATRRSIHTIHDAEAHCGILGGLCGFRAEDFSRLAPTFEDFIKTAGWSDEQWARHGADQDFLNGFARPRLTTFGHSLRVNGHNRSAAMGSIRYVTEIAAPPANALASVAPDVRAMSDTLAPYLGSAGYQLDKAINFYNQVCPEIDKILEAESA